MKRTGIFLRETTMNKLSIIIITGLILVYTSTGSAAVVGYWSFDNSGNPGYDDSGNGNNGTVYGATWITPAKINGGLSLDGDDYVGVADSPALNITEGTWEACIKFDVLPSVAGLMNPLAKQEQYWIHASSDDSIQVKVSVGGTRYIASTGPNFITLDTWYHVIGIYDGEDLKLYVDGNLENTNTAPSGNIDSGNKILAIGTWSSPIDYFHGTIDEVRVYNHAVPEPATLLLLGLGGLALRKKRRV
jgi:hypothetical protein